MHRRFIKTHTPLDGISYFPSCEYLLAYRGPKGACFSRRNHLLNMQNPPDLPQLAADFNEGFRAWVEELFEPGAGGQRSLEAFIQHFCSFRNYQHLENFHFFHYSDVKTKLDAVVCRIAEKFGMKLAQNEVARNDKAVSFDGKKKNASAFSPGTGKQPFKSDEVFFSSGKNNQWQGILNETELDNYTRRLKERLPSNEIQWLEKEVENT